MARKSQPEGSQSSVSGWRRLRGGLIELVLIVVGALIISAGMRAFVGQMFVIPSGSMEQTLEIGDRVEALKVTDFKRGDIVVFKDSEHWLGGDPAKRSVPGQVLEFIGLLPNTSSNYLIKRVIGMPGDTVSCCTPQGRMSVNGKALDESDYLYREQNGQTVASSSIAFTVTVPKDRIFVMGDHRDASGDSRFHLSDVGDEYTGASAFVPIGDVVGPAKAVVVPLSRIRVLRTPAAFDGIEDRSSRAPARAAICLGESCPRP